MGNLLSYYYDYYWSGQVDRVKLEVRQKLMRAERRVNVLVVGLPAQGKSTLITSMQHGLVDEREDLAPAGVLADGGSFTLRLRKYPMITRRLDGVLYLKTPTVFDMPGLRNEDTHTVRAMLRCIMQGKVPVDERILIHNQEDIEGRYEVRDENKIDRVIFVQSCRQNVPENFTRALLNVCGELGIILYSVLTKIDLVERDAQVRGREGCTRQELELAVGTHGSPRGFAAELYHDPVDGRFKRIPRTDYTLLNLWWNLLNENYPFHSVQ